MLNSPLTGFADASGQHVFYLDAQERCSVPGCHNVNQFLVSSTGVANVDLTKWSGGTPAFADSLTSVSNQWGPQVFYHCPQAICGVNANTGAYTNLSQQAGGEVPFPYFSTGGLHGSSLSSIDFDDKRYEDVFYIDDDLYIWEIHTDNGSTWSSYLLFHYCDSPSPPAGQ